MPEPLQLEVVSQFLGENRGVAPVILPGIYSPSLSSNLRIDVWGRLTNRLGYTVQNTGNNVYTMNGGGPALRVRGITAFRTVGGGVETHQLVFVLEDADEWELHYSTDGGLTSTFIVDLGGASGATGTVPDFAQFGDELFITNGVNTPRKWSGAVLTQAGATQSPTPTATAVGSSTGSGPLDGTYTYKLVSVEADGTRSPGSVASNVEPVEKGTMTLSWTADSNPDVVAYEVYRTTGTGTSFYFVGLVDGRLTVSYDDSNSDQTILRNRSLTDHGDPPPEGTYFVEAHLGRMWWMRTDDEPLRVWYSDTGLPESVGILNYFDCKTAGAYSDKITGGVGDYEKKLVVFTERSIWTIGGSGVIIGGIQDFNLKRTSAGVGSVSHNTVVRVPAGAIYTDSRGDAHETLKGTLAYLSSNQDIRLFDGENDTIISTPVHDAIRETWANNGRHKCWALHNSQEGMITWWWAVSGNEVGTQAVTWDYRHGGWFTWTFANALSCGIEVPSNPTPLALLVGSGEAGLMLRFWNGDFDEHTTDSSIECEWVTSPIFGYTPEDTRVRERANPPMASDKRFRWLEFAISREGAGANMIVNVEWSRSTYQSGEPAWEFAKSFILSSPSIAGEVEHIRVPLKGGTGQQAGDYTYGAAASFAFSWGTIVATPTATAKVYIHAYTVAYQMLTGLKRRFQ